MFLIVSYKIHFVTCVPQMSLSDDNVVDVDWQVQRSTSTNSSRSEALGLSRLFACMTELLIMTTGSCSVRAIVCQTTE